MPENEVIDINDPLLQQQMIEADPEANAFEPPPPPPDDREYQVRITMEEQPTAKRQQKKTDQKGMPTGPLMLNFPLVLRITDPNQPWDNQPLFDYASSLVMDNSGTSRLHSILRAIRAPALGRMTLAELRDHAVNVLATEPTAFIEGHWESQVEAPNEKRAKNGYLTVRRGMKTYPLDDSKPSGHNHIWIDERWGKAPAKFRVDNYLIR